SDSRHGSGRGSQIPCRAARLYGDLDSADVSGHVWYSPVLHGQGYYRPYLAVYRRPVSGGLPLRLLDPQRPDRRDQPPGLIPSLYMAQALPLNGAPESHTSRPSAVRTRPTGAAIPRGFA